MRCDRENEIGESLFGFRQYVGKFFGHCKIQGA
jgi:hypothetical protein